MQNILFFIFRLHGGGAERVVSNLSVGISEKYNVKIAVFDKSDQTYPFKGELIRIKLPFSENPAGNKWWARACRLFVLIYKLRKLKKIHKIDVSVSFAEPANIINVLTKGRTKTILSVRTLLSKHLVDTSNPKLFQGLIKYLYNCSDQVIVPSKMVEQDLISQFKLFPSKVKLIYNYTEREKIEELSKEIIEDPFYKNLFEQQILLNVGRITLAKGQWLLPQLLYRLKPKYKNLKLVIIGEAENGDDVKMHLVYLANQLGLKLYDHSLPQLPSLDFDIFLLGFKTNPFCYMRHSKILLFPSVFEGFPNTLLEAMQCGLPVVSSDCYAGPREILAPDSDPEKRTDKMECRKYGILCPPIPSLNFNDNIPDNILGEWILAVTTLIKDDALRNELAQNGYQRVKDFDKKIILRQWEESIIKQ